MVSSRLHREDYFPDSSRHQESKDDDSGTVAGGAGGLFPPPMMPALQHRLFQCSLVIRKQSTHLAVRVIANRMNLRSKLLS